MLACLLQQCRPPLGGSRREARKRRRCSHVASNSPGARVRSASRTAQAPGLECRRSSHVRAAPASQCGRWRQLRRLSSRRQACPDSRCRAHRRERPPYVEVVLAPRRVRPVGQQVGSRRAISAVRRPSASRRRSRTTAGACEPGSSGPAYAAQRRRHRAGLQPPLHHGDVATRPAPSAGRGARPADPGPAGGAAGPVRRAASPVSPTRPRTARTAARRRSAPPGGGRAARGSRCADG